MNTLLKDLVLLLRRLARAPDEDIPASCWRIVFTLLRLAILLTMLTYWLIRLMQAFLILA